MTEVGVFSTPAVHIGLVLRECRRRDYEFGAAWDMALRSLPRGRTPDQREYLSDWKDALRWAKENFRIAYEVEHERNRISRQPTHAEVAGDCAGAAREAGVTARAA